MHVHLRNAFVRTGVHRKIGAFASGPVPFFFVWTGMLLEVDVLLDWPGVWGLAGILLLLVAIGKAAASWIVGAVYGYHALDRLLMIGLTIPQAAATLAITVTAREAGLFGEEVVDAIIIVIFVSCLLGTLISARVGERLAADSSRNPELHPMQPTANERRPR